MSYDSTYQTHSFLYRYLSHLLDFDYKPPHNKLKMTTVMAPLLTRPTLRIAFEGCGHGKLRDIYDSIARETELKGWDGVDLVVIGGDFQAIRNSHDMSCMSVPQQYKEIGDFHEYYSGKRTAPYLTIFIGGNHEASNHLFELYYGGWVAENIYYLGAANILRCGPLRIAALSGIWKGYDYRKPHFERLPYNRDDIQSIYHVRELDARKLLQIRTQVDLGLSHDWPRKIEYGGDFKELFRKKNGFEDDSLHDKLGSVAAKLVLDRLRPAQWFSAHLHVKFTGSIGHSNHHVPNGRPQNQPQAPSSGCKDDMYVPSFGLDGTYLSSLHPDSAVGATQATSLEKPKPTDSDTRVINEMSVEQKVPQVNKLQGNDKSGQRAEVREPRGDRGSRISAWQNFHAVASKQEAEATALYRKEREARRNKEHVAEPPPESNHQLTWRKVKVGQDYSDRKISEVEKTGFEEEPGTKRPKIESKTVVKNTDEISLNLDTDSDTAPPIHNSTVSVRDNGSNLPDAATDPKEPPPPQVEESVPRSLRDQLPPSFSCAGQNQQERPDAISNMSTNFLALDKCVRGREFLCLQEFTVISDQNGIQAERPYRLQYDKEWLAITRVFAEDLILGDRTAAVSPDKGEDYYRRRIVVEEEWVEEHVIKAGKSTVPENFIPTAPYYDPCVPITTQQMPPEYNNPQTEQFCNLVGIENKFHQSDEARQQRISAGPHPQSPLHYIHRGGRYGRDNRHRKGKGGNGGGNRGGKYGGGKGGKYGGNGGTRRPQQV